MSGHAAKLGVRRLVWLDTLPIGYLTPISHGGGRPDRVVSRLERLFGRAPVSAGRTTALHSCLVAVTAAGAAVTVALSMDAGAAGAATSTRSAMGGQAFGSTVRLGTLARSDKTAYVPLCTTRFGVTRKDHSAAVHLPGVGRIGAVTTRMASRRTSVGPRSTAQSRTAATTLFAGVVQATVLTSRAVAERSDGRTRLTGATTVVGLTIAGHAVSNPVPNKTMTVPGIGTAIINQQTRSRRFGNPTIAVTALRIRVAKNNSNGLPAGQLVIGHSVASLHQPTHHQVRGAAWGTTVQVGKAVKSGRTAPVYLPCGGTSGQTRTRNATAAVLLPHALRSGDVSSQATSTDTARRTGATTRSHIARVSLVGGKVRARGITAQATAARLAGGQLERSARDTNILSLDVNGQNHPISRKPNTKYRLPGIGTLWIHRVIPSRNGLRVVALELILGRSMNGLQRGAVITAGTAEAAVLRI